jgi:multidrug efflux pump subunit AcrB
LYSISHPGKSIIIVRFYVGTSEEDAIIRTYNKLYSNFDRIPPAVSQPLIKARSIDDVPVLAVTLWGKNYDAYRLRLAAGELNNAIKQVENVSETKIIGGTPRGVLVLLDTARLSAYGLSPSGVASQLQASNSRTEAGSFASGNQEIRVDAGKFLSSAEDLGKIVVGVHSGFPVYLRDVAQIEDGPTEPDNYVLFGNGAGARTTKQESSIGSEASRNSGAEFPAVTITVAKRKATNATIVAGEVLKRIQEMRKNSLPPDLNISITRNYGETAKDKSDELLKHLLLATFSVTLLVALALGWRESGVVLLAIPVTLALTLFIFYFYGYTLNRVTLFALIFSIGILVDDAIVVVENIVRHFRLPQNK